MRINVFKTKQEASIEIAKIMDDLVASKPDASLGFATGSTFILTYAEMAKLSKINKTDYDHVRTFNLDEYLNTKGDEPFCYRYFMNEKLFKHLNLSPQNINFPAVDIDYSSLKTNEYDQIIDNIGIDIQLVGLGRNGHIAFNEPGSSKSTGTRVVKLAQTTIEDHANHFFGGNVEKVPKEAVSMGVASILKAKKIILAAWEKPKAEAVAHLFSTEPETSQWPVTYLKWHNDVDVFITEEILNNIDQKFLANPSLELIKYW